MNITNIANLPEPLVRAVTRHPRKRSSNSISVSELIQPPQMRALSVLHDNDLSEDAGERIWALLGTLMHQALENHAQGLKNVLAEQELKTTVLGWEVIGHYDLSEMVLDGELLTDYKLTSVWAVKEGVKREWEEQLNTYAQLIRLAGRRVDQLQLVAIGRDWSKNKAKFDLSYPQQQVKVMSVPLWTAEQATEYLEERVRIHQAAEKGMWPECTEEERWVRDKKWAVMKTGAKKAIRLYDSNSAALIHVKSDPMTLYVQHRPGSSVRCESYCAVANICPQRKRELEAA